MHSVHLGSHAAYGHSGHAASGFLGHVVHMMFDAAIYVMMFRLLRHIPLPLLILIVVIAVFIGYRRARTTGRRPW